MEALWATFKYIGSNGLAVAVLVLGGEFGDAGGGR